MTIAIKNDFFSQDTRKPYTADSEYKDVLSAEQKQIAEKSEKDKSLFDVVEVSSSLDQIICLSL
jgi:hypothetical protein